MLWHKCKNGTLVNLDQCVSIGIWNREAFHWKEENLEGKWDYILAANSESNSEATLCTGTREECAAELRAIEENLGLKKPGTCPRCGNEWMLFGTGWATNGRYGQRLACAQCGAEEVYIYEVQKHDLS